MLELSSQRSEGKDGTGLAAPCGRETPSRFGLLFRQHCRNSTPFLQVEHLDFAETPGPMNAGLACILLSAVAWPPTQLQGFLCVRLPTLAPENSTC